MTTRTDGQKGRPTGTSVERSKHPDELIPAGAEERSQQARQPSRIEHRGWRGEGIVGDRHTD